MTADEQEAETREDGQPNASIIWNVQCETLNMLSKRPHIIPEQGLKVLG